MMVEFARDTVEEVEKVTDELIKALKKASTAIPILL